MNKYAKVIDKNGLVRDMESKAVLNTDKQALIEHRKKRKIMLDLMGQDSRISKIENDLSEIKTLLMQLIKN